MLLSAIHFLIPAGLNAFSLFLFYILFIILNMNLENKTAYFLELTI